MKKETTQFTIMLRKSSKPAAVIEKINQSPRGLKSFDAGGVGLGIVAALEKPGSACSNKALFARNLSRSNPVPVRSATEEDYTVVTCHEPKVYATAPFRLHSSNIRGSVFHISPAKIGDSAGVPPPDFLSACNLCRKGLHGVDIYMYRGEKAFCSPECRYREMAMDERAEKCRSEAARPPVEAASASSPNYNANGQILTNGILAI